MKTSAAKTVNEIFELALSTHYASEKFERSGYKGQVISLYKMAIDKQLGHRIFNTLTPPVIHKWHLSLKETPYQANRAKSLLSKLFSIAALYGLVDMGQNPCSVVPSFPEQSRRRYASAQEIKKIKELLDDALYATPQAAVFIYLLLYTGARPSSIERAKRSELTVDQNTGTGTLIRVGKTGIETIVIPPQGMKLLNQLPIPRDGSLVGCKMPTHLWEKIRKALNAPDLWMRDLRRTFATLGMGAGISIDQIAEILGHKTTQTTKIYAKLSHEIQAINALKIAELI